MEKTKIYHSPVLLHESIKGLNIKPDGIYVDVTYGGGGHAKSILSQLNSKGKLFAFDTDPDAQTNLIEESRLVLIPENFRFINRFLRLYGVVKVDGILADLGVSSHQFDDPERGFSTRWEGRLDMRMNQNHPISAWDIINTYDEEKLNTILSEYGELHAAKAMSKAIISARNIGAIDTTDQLKKTLTKFTPKGRENKIWAQIFQAIRIEVNQELEVLKEFLVQVPDLLNEGGRLSVISYHSLEDRLVKRFIRNGMFDGEPPRDMFGNYNVPMKKIGNHIVPTFEEIKVNNRARSAKLRIAEKI